MIRCAKAVARALVRVHVVDAAMVRAVVFLVIVQNLHNHVLGVEIVNHFAGDMRALCANMVCAAVTLLALQFTICALAQVAVVCSRSSAVPAAHFDFVADHA